MTAVLTQLQRVVALTQRQRCFTESTVLFEMVNWFKMYVIKMKRGKNINIKKEKRKMKIL